VSATDTFTFDEAGKIKNQNVAFTSAAPSNLPVSAFRFAESAAAKCRGQRPAWQQTMLRIKDPKKSLPYYTEIFGMTLIDVFDFPGMKFSLYFLTTLPKGEEYTLTPGSPEAHAYNWSMKGTTLELTYNYGSEADDTKYHAGNQEKDGFGHIAFNCNDVYEACAKLEEQGVTFKKKPDEGRMKGLAFAYDPDGYWVEIVRRAEGMDPAVFPYYNFSQTMLRVKDPEKSLAFYRDTLGMTLLSQKTLGEGTDWGFSLYFLGTVAEGEEAPTPGSSFQPCLELTHNHGTESDESFAHFSGNEDGRKGFGHLGFLVDDVYEASAAFAEMGCEFVKEPDGGSMKGLAFVKDPDGYWIEIIKRGGEERIDAMAASDTQIYGM